MSLNLPVFRFDSVKESSFRSAGVPFVALSSGSESDSDEWSRVLEALDWLDREIDVAAVGWDSSVTTKGFEDMAAPSDGTLEVFRVSAVLDLLDRGYRPTNNWRELSCALRVCGWRVCAGSLNSSRLAPDSRAFRSGRDKAAREIYALTMDSILASGPRSVRLSGPFRLLAGLRSWAAGTGPSAYHLGYFFEVVRQTLTAQVARMRRARWRAAPFEASFSGDDTATTTVLLFTANRPWYLRRSLRALERFWPSRGGYRLVVSQDGDDQATNSILESLPTGVEHWKFSEQVRLPWRQWIRGRMPYFRIAQHFGHALRRVFANSNTRRVIILEDDMEIGPDFFGYFECLSRVLQENPDLLTASAWNDHGGAATNPTAVHRTDCFPGLGWLLERGGWEVLETCWPQSYWDDVLRQIPELKGYQHLRPDVCRIRNFGRTGTGSSAFFEQHIAATPIQGRPVDWSSVELTLDYQGYRERLFSRIARSRPCRNGHSADTDHDHHLLYGDFTEFQELARELGILPEFRPDAPRAAFEGVVILERGDHALYLVPRLLWERLSSGEPPS